MRKKGENYLKNTNYLITASAGPTLVYLSIDDETNDAFWSRNISKATLWDSDIDGVYMDSIIYIEKAMRNTTEHIIYASIMIHEVNYVLSPIENIMTMKVAENMDKMGFDDVINSAKSFSGREIEMWCIKNIRFSWASDIYNKYFNRELLKERDSYAPSPRAYYFVIKNTSDEYILHRDYDRSGPAQSRPYFKKY